ncbi:DMT family transporter [Allomuricauda sp.]|jgi:drug/metabolite transporter (DMT)-like permease|uniref:DMT family transporter n=1 Tax=Flagellimonas sp. TaxID=2058762 RepID=UPI001B08D3CA|nr:DMT family transporter [Allomuricauda sp.]MBO6531997.1 DMT family transporter [Allomuricauda sp.]MBO6587825.1 DMT family transporter [Allomuricauda sp.]MBO6617450.1 DMT family transporter [Allomuricauda sp.]MBO6643539.1 DMT family transporter [Allomuricauda sp.]MBO6745785.1 DMT family transporter [Allomuricauda sp.]
MSKRTLAILAAIGATVIYGINHTVAKGVMPMHVQPFGFIFLRVGGAAILFWLISILGPKQKIEKRDWGRLFICSLLGMSINMLSFFKGLQLSTPINSAVLVTITPIIVVMISALFLREKITLNKGLGIAMGFVGALGLILFGAEIRQDAPNIPLGNSLFILNATAYGAYLVVVKKLIEKYHPFTLMKWLFSMAFIINLPITLPEVLEIEWSTMPLWAYGSVAFVVIGTTFLTYLFNIFALTELKASSVGAFMYMQPLVGILFALLSHKDHLTLIKILAMAFVLVGVYLASKKPRRGIKHPKEA